MNFKSIILILLISICAINYAELGCSTKSSRPVDTYIIDLDKPPRQRFFQLASDYKKEIISYIKVNKESIPLPPFIIKLAELVAAEIDSFFPYPFNEELKGISDALEGAVSLGDVVLANLIYDLTAFCTGIIATQSNGQIIHGRNLDYDYSPYLQNATVKAKFIRNGTLVFTSAHLAGYIGLLTAHKYKAFTFSINERDQGNWWDNLIAALTDKNVKPLSFLTREVLENSTSFTDAVNKFSKENIIAPAYFILGGVQLDQGVVLTRNQTHLIDAWRLDSRSSGIEKWYLLETNYDHWTPPPPNDDRRDPGMKAMNQTTQESINQNTLLRNVLAIYPVCNKETVYSATMSAMEEDSLEIIIQ